MPCTFMCNKLSFLIANVKQSSAVHEIFFMFSSWLIQPVTSNEKRATSNEKRATSNEKLATSNNPPIPKFLPWHNSCFLSALIINNNLLIK